VSERAELFWPDSPMIASSALLTLSPHREFIRLYLNDKPPGIEFFLALKKISRSRIPRSSGRKRRSKWGNEVMGIRMPSRRSPRRRVTLKIQFLRRTRLWTQLSPFCSPQVYVSPQDTMHYINLMYTYRQDQFKHPQKLVMNRHLQLKVRRPI
jgi:hypothetical protein